MLIYLAGPLSAKTPAGVKRNLTMAAKVAARLWKAGHAVWSPHGHTGSFFGMADVPDQRFLALDLTIIEHVPFDAIVLLPGWQHSRGTAAEIKAAKRKKIKIIEWTKMEPSRVQRHRACADRTGDRCAHGGSPRRVCERLAVDRIT